MSFIKKALSLFSVSVLDTRLEPPEDEKKKASITQSAGPNRWSTGEYYIYGVIFLVFVPLMFKTVIDASSGMSISYCVAFVVCFANSLIFFH